MFTLSMALMSQSGYRSTYTEIWKIATNSCPPHCTDRCNLTRVPWKDIPEIKQQQVSKLPPVTYDGNAHAGSQREKAQCNSTRGKYRLLTCSVAALKDSFPSLCWGHQPHTWISLLLHSQATLMNLLPPIPPKTCKGTCLANLKSRGLDGQEMQLCIFPFHALSIYFFPMSLKKVAEINGEQRNKKKTQLWPTPCLLLKEEGALPKEEEKNVLRHNGSKGQAANQATLYC